MSQVLPLFPLNTVLFPGGPLRLRIFEPRSNTMKLGTHSAALAGALSQADQIWMYQGPTVTWDVAGSVASLGKRAETIRDLDELIDALDRSLVSGDHVLIMSNGGFGGIHGKLLDRLRKR